jgi:transposase
MSMYSQALRERRRAKVVDLLKKGLKTRQIAERVGMTTRSVLRIKKQELENAHGREEAT